MERNLILVRGVSGSGKSTFAELICDVVFSADQYFEDGKGNYNFDATKLGKAHGQCIAKTEKHMKAGFEKICVANTFTTERELSVYFDLAKQYSYKVFSVIVENRHGGTNVHNVPEEVLTKQAGRFAVKLR